MKPNPAHPDDLMPILLWALDAGGKPLLSAPQARCRAEAISQQIAACGFDLRIVPWRNVTPAGYVHPFPAYDLADLRYDLNSVGAGERGQFAVEGPGFSLGDLLRFGRACEIMGKHFPGGWPKETRDQLRDPQSHLDAIEEILWIGRFQGVQEVRSKVPQPNGKDADWSFKVRGQPVTIEVKNFRKEFVGFVDGSSRGRLFSSWHESLIGKFSRDNPASLNIACVTTYLEPDESLSERAGELLGSGEPIDALAIWSYHAPRGHQFTAFGSPETLEILEAILSPVQREDSERCVLLGHPMRNKTAQRVVTLEEALASLTRLEKSAKTALFGHRIIPTSEKIY